MIKKMVASYIDTYAGREENTIKEVVKMQVEVIYQGELTYRCAIK
jgi:acyl CoA:acetate/3-ketoacid CoA transferase alpha subunit